MPFLRGPRQFLLGLHRRPSGPSVIAALGSAVSIALAAVSIVVLRPFTASSELGMISPAPAGQAPFQLAAGRLGPARPLSARAIAARIEPSVVDVTAELTYDDETASGTGFVVDPRLGLVLTNNHVIRDATSVSVRVTATGKSYPARIVGVDVPADIAVLQIQPVPGLTAAPLGDSAALAAGTRVVSFGNQAGTNGAPVVAPGVITGTGRAIKAADGTSGVSEVLHGMLATSAKIEPGDSGGPLADSAGTVIGVDTATGTVTSNSGGGAAGRPGQTTVGYAIPINTALTAERQITAGQAGSGVSLGTSGFLGVIVGSGQAQSPAAQQQAQQRSSSSGTGKGLACADTEADAGVPAAIAPAATGALVMGVLCETGAATAGLTPGVVITAVAGQPVTSPDALVSIVDHCQPGTVVSVTWVDATGGTKTARIRLTAAPAA